MLEILSNMQKISSCPPLLSSRQSTAREPDCRQPTDSVLLLVTILTSAFHFSTAVPQTCDLGSSQAMQQTTSLPSLLFSSPGMANDLSPESSSQIAVSGNDLDNRVLPTPAPNFRRSAEYRSDHRQSAASTVRQMPNRQQAEDRKRNTGSPETCTTAGAHASLRVVSGAQKTPGRSPSSRS